MFQESHFVEINLIYLGICNDNYLHESLEKFDRIIVLLIIVCRAFMGIFTQIKIEPKFELLKQKKIFKNDSYK